MSSNIYVQCRLFYTLVMQCFWVGYYGISHKSHEFSLYKHKPLGDCVYQENTSDKWDVPCYTMRERCITILYHAIEDTVANTIDATYAQRMMGRLGVIPFSNIQLLSCFDWLYLLLMAF